MPARTCRGASVLLMSVAMASCSPTPDEPEFTYGRDEMLAGIEGTWEGTSSTGGGETPMTMTLTYAAPGTKTLCGNRMLSRESANTLGAVAPRCIDMSSVNVTGTINTRLTATEAARDIAIRGTFDVMSLNFDGHGNLSANVDGRQLGATLANDLLEGNVSGQDPGTALKFSLHRRK